MINNLILLQVDLQKGMSIEEALQKHNLTFKEAFTELDKYKMGRPHKNKNLKKEHTPQEKDISDARYKDITISGNK